MKTLLLAGSWAGAIFATSASAVTYSFSYVFDAFASISGTMEGSETGGILTVDDVVATITSTGGTLGTSSFGFDTGLGGYHISGNFDTDPGTLALDGSFFDLAVIALSVTNACASGEGFCLIDTFASATIPSAGETYTLAPGSFSISEIAAVPLPASLPLLGLGLAVFGLVRRRQQA